MNLKEIEYILKIDEERNVTRAAEKLYLTPSALNQQLLRLDLPARLGGVRAAAACVRGSALPAPPHGKRGRHRRHPGAQIGRAHV